MLPPPLTMALSFPRLRQLCALALLTCLLCAGGCAAEADEATGEDQGEINRFFDGPVVRKLINLMNDVDSAEAATAEDNARLGKEMSTFR